MLIKEKVNIMRIFKTTHWKETRWQTRFGLWEERIDDEDESDNDRFDYDEFDEDFDNKLHQNHSLAA